MLTIVANIPNKIEVEKTTQTITPSLLQAFADNYASGVLSDIDYYTVTSQEETRINNQDEYTLVWNVDDLTGIDFSIDDAKPRLKVTIGQLGVKADIPGDVQLDQSAIWSAGSYSLGDVVQRGAALYQCTKQSTSQTPTNSASDWDRKGSATDILFEIVNISGEVNTSYNENILIPIESNNGEFPILCNFTSGVCEQVFAFKNISDCGEWYIPSNDTNITIRDTNLNPSGIKVYNQEKMEVILPF